MVTTQNFALLLIQGFLTISAEILAIRLFTPHFGSGPVQTSVIIGTVLLFSAIGSIRSPIDRPDGIKLNFTLLLASAILLCNPSIYVVKNILLNLGIEGFYIRIFLLSLITVAPFSFFSGRGYPLLIKRFGETNLNLGIAVGTFGSFLGAVLTALLLVYLFPASRLLVVNALFMSVLAFWISEKKFIVLNSVFFITICYLNLVTNRTLVTWESGMADYNMEESPGFKGLIINGGKYSSMIHSDGRTMPYNDALHSLLLKDSTPLDVLVLGAGGFTLSITGPEHRYTFVDSDPEIRRIIQEKFNPQSRGEFIHSDAREYFVRNKKSFDLIFQDIYDGSPVVPRYLLTLEHFLEIKRHLRNGGYAGFNLTHKGPITQGDGERIARTLQTAFSVCYFVPVHGKSMGIRDDSLRQTVALCQKNLRRQKIIIDDEY